MKRSFFAVVYLVIFGGLILPGFVSAGNCAVVCTPAGGPARPTATAIDPDDTACQLRCTPATGTTFPRSCQAGDTCRATFTASSLEAAPTAPTSTAPQTSAPAAPATPNRGSVPLQLSQPIDGVTVVSDFGNYIAVLFRYAIGLAGTAAVIMIVYGGFLFLLGSAVDDVGKGKQVIQDALIGLVLVLGSYMILATVNPNTLSLKLPDIRPIEAIALPPPSSAPSPPTTTNICGDPVTSPAFRRPSPRSVQRGNGEPCSYDAECTSRKCFMQNQTQGICSDLTENQRCKCIGSCCDSMTSSNQGGTFLNDTNNGGVGNALCANGLVCQFRENDWKCTRLSYAAAGGSVQTGTPQRPPEHSRPSCRLDSECVTALGAGAACLYNSRQTGSLTGRTECSLGREGDQCQCSGTGCDLIAPPNVRITGAQTAMGNNGGTRAVACQTGLVCAPFLRPSGTLSDPRDIEYFCQRPEALRAALPLGTATCRFSCADGSPAGIQRVPNGCDVGDVGRVEGSRACLQACASVCGTSPGTSVGAACLGLRCEAAASSAP